MNVQDWAERAEIGERVVYAKRDPNGDFDRPAHVMGLTLRSAYEAHCRGLVFIAQRRRGGSWAIDYEATRISRPTAVTLKILTKQGATLTGGLA